MDDNSLVEGETNITASKRSIRELMLSPADAGPLPETLDAIAAADLITLGPGSLYTSLITNLLVRGIPEAIAASNATRVYICNLMTQANESLGLSAAQHIEKILDHARARGLSKDAHIFDYALINTAPISAATLTKYAREGQAPIVADLDRIRALGIEPITGNFLHEGDVLRHNYDRVAETVLRAVSRHPHQHRSQAPAAHLRLETLGLLRVAFKVHASNQRSQASVKSIGGIYEGTFRNHLRMPDGTQRDSAWYSIIDKDWPEVKDMLTRRLKAPV
jgi:hypothetical protein